MEGLEIHSDESTDDHVSVGHGADSPHPLDDGRTRTYLLVVGALKYLWASFRDLIRGMLCPCGPKWDPDNFVPADVAEGYVDRITHLEQNNKDLQMKLDWATRQHGPMPDPPVDNTAQTPEPATTSMSGAMLVAMNVVTTVVTGAGCLLAYWYMGENPELGTATGMSMPGMAAQKRALP